MNTPPAATTAPPTVGVEREARTVAQVMVRKPKRCGPDTRVGELRRFFRDDHVHSALVVDDGVLVTVVEPEDIGDSGLADVVPAAGLGRLLDRVVLESTPLCLVRRRMLATGQRRLAVVDDAGRLVGLLCLNHKRDGFCSDDDVWARAIAPGTTRAIASTPRSPPACAPVYTQSVPVNPPAAGSGADHVLAVLERWCQFGGTWRVTGRTNDQVTISLCRCDGAEEQQRIVTSEPYVLAWLTSRSGGGAPETPVIDE